MRLCILVIFLLTLSINSFGRDLAIDEPLGKARGLVILAPAKKYLMHERLFVHLAKELQKQGFIAVRFNWSENTLTQPSLELTRAYEDLRVVIQEMQQKYKMSSQKTTVITKSFSTKALGDSVNLARSHILITPNCSATETFSSVYADILQQTNKNISIFISKEDPYCDVRQILSALASQEIQRELFITQGDHNFVRTSTTDSSRNFHYQDQVIHLITSMMSSDL